MVSQAEVQVADAWARLPTEIGPMKRRVCRSLVESRAGYVGSPNANHLCKLSGIHTRTPSMTRHLFGISSARFSTGSGNYLDSIFIKIMKLLFLPNKCQKK